MKSINLEKLLKRKDQLDARIKVAQTKTQLQNRKNETRRKILTGAYILEKYSQENRIDMLVKELDTFLSRPQDRSLFGLPPKDSNNNF